MIERLIYGDEFVQWARGDTSLFDREAVKFYEESATGFRQLELLHYANRASRRLFDTMSRR